MTSESAWTRTEIYSRPFRVIQFDTVKATPADHSEADYNYVLTAICCFSRFCWLIPIKDRGAETIGKALLERVLLDMAMFPVVLRSDRAQEFTSSVIGYMNRQLEIKQCWVRPTIPSRRAWWNECTEQ